MGEGTNEPQHLVSAAEEGEGEIEMCAYCMLGDSWFRHDPPFDPDRWKYPTIPQPAVPTLPPPWSLEKLKEYLEILRLVKELEDKIGCPCEPNKADYIKVLQERIDLLEHRKKKRRRPHLTTKKARRQSGRSKHG